MPSIAPLTLLPPKPLVRNDSNSASSPSDSSFGDALRKAQGQGADSPDDSSDAASQPAQPTDSDPSSTSQTTPADKTDKAEAPKKAAQPKAAAGKKKTETTDDSDDDDADAKAVGAKLPVEDSTAKPAKKPVAKTAESNKSAGENGAAVAGQPGVKTDSSDPTKAADGDSTAGDGATTVVKAVDGTTAEDGGVQADPAEGTAGGVGEAGHRSVKGKFKGAESAGSKGNAEATLAAAAGVSSFAGGGSNSGGDDSSDAVSAVDGNSSSAGGGDASTEAALAASVSSTTAKPEQAIAAPPPVKLSPQQQFVEDNHPKIVTGVTGELMPGGGTMQIRLDPQNLGAIQVTVHMKDGVMSAAFETSNDDSTRLLSHSLGQLKSSLEAGGIAVDKMHVQQSAKKDGAGTDDSDSKSSKQQDAQGQSKRDQQRQELIKRMWAKLSGGDPLDLVA